MTARLDISASAYFLGVGEGAAWKELARLVGGAAALLPSGSQQITHLDIEAAIERAEDWLMPHAKALAGAVLEVQDATGALVAGLGGPADWTTDQVEAEFNRVVDLPDRSSCNPVYVAHLVLVRELMHHGRLTVVHVRGPRTGGDQ